MRILHSKVRKKYYVIFIIYINLYFTENNWENISYELKDLIKSCLRIEPQNRPSAQDLLKNPIFQIKIQKKEGMLNDDKNLLTNVHEELHKFKVIFNNRRQFILECK